MFCTFGNAAKQAPSHMFSDSGVSIMMDVGRISPGSYYMLISIQTWRHEREALSGLVRNILWQSVGP